MKKMLIVGITMSAAGTENSFLNFSRHIDFSEWEVDLLLAKREGDFLNLIPKQINVMDMGEDGELFVLSKDNSRGVINSFYQKRPFSMFKLFPTLLHMNFAKGKNKTYAKNNLWIRMMKEMPSLEKEYDLAIGYWGDRTMFYVVDKVKAKHKMAWMHFNFNSPPRSPKTYRRYINKIDRIVAVSEECAKSITETVPSAKEKVVVFENYIDSDRVRSLAAGESPFEEGKYNIVTVGRINYDKGYDVALPGVLKFLEEHKDASWHIIGDGSGSYYDEFMSKLNGSDCKDRVILYGVRKNPYIYIMYSDVYLQPSRNESQCMAVEETKVLGKPIIATRYQTADRQLDYGRLGIVCDFDSESIYKSLEEMKKNSKKREKFFCELKKYRPNENQNIEELLDF